MDIILIGVAVMLKGKGPFHRRGVFRPMQWDLKRTESSEPYGFVLTPIDRYESAY
jgi:hypothetical protein